jgi:pyruvate dehydrogenase (quinone)
MAEWRAMFRKQETRTDKPMKPQVVAEFGQRLAPNAMVSSDSGTNTTWWARHFQAKRGQMFSCSGNLATVACGLPFPTQSPPRWRILGGGAWPWSATAAFRC